MEFGYTQIIILVIVLAVLIWALFYIGAINDKIQAIGGQYLK